MFSHGDIAHTVAPDLPMAPLTHRATPGHNSMPPAFFRSLNLTIVAENYPLGRDATHRLDPQTMHDKDIEWYMLSAVNRMPPWNIMRDVIIPSVFKTPLHTVTRALSHIPAKPYAEGIEARSRWGEGYRDVVFTIKKL